MSTVKISQLPLITLSSNTSNSILLGVDVGSSVTGKFTATQLAQKLYSFNPLNVGNNNITLPNTIAQFSLSGEAYIQTNLVNLNDGGTADVVVTANTGTDTTYFIDLGLANKNFQPGAEYNSLGTSIYPLDGYLYVQGGAIGSPGGPGGNLTIGTTTANTEVKFILGGPNSQNVAYKIDYQGLKLQNNRQLYFTDGTSMNTASMPASYAQAAFNAANTASNNIIALQSQVLTLNANVAAVNTFTQAAFNKANNASGNTIALQTYSTLANGNIIALQSYSTLANGNIIALQTYSTLANGNVIALQTYSTLANGNIAALQTYSTLANGNIIALQSQVATLNANVAAVNTFTQAAFNKANNALANATGIFSGNLTVTGNINSSSSNSGGVIISNNTISSVLTNQDLVIGQTTATANLVINRTINAVKEVNVTGNITAAGTYSTVGLITTGNLIVNGATLMNGIANIAGNVIPTSTNTYSLGTITSRWRDVWIGPGTLNITDTITGNNAALTVANNVLQIQGVNQLQVGQLKFIDNTIQSTTPGNNILIGYTTDTANLVLNRNVITSTVSSIYAAGEFIPAKGITNTIRSYSGAQTAITLSFATDSLVRANIAAPLAVTLSNFRDGKIIDLIITNTSTGGGANKVITHGCSALNSSVGATTFTLSGTTTAVLKYYSFDDDLANTYVAVTFS